MSRAKRKKFSLEDRARITLNSRHLTDDGGVELPRVYSDLRALCRVPPGDNVFDHYERIYKAMTPTEQADVMD